MKKLKFLKNNIDLGTVQWNDKPNKNKEPNDVKKGTTYYLGVGLQSPGDCVELL